jgi:hypothetical protein
MSDVFSVACFYISCLNMAAVLSNSTVVGGQAMSLFCFQKTSKV